MVTAVSAKMPGKAPSPSSPSSSSNAPKPHDPRVPRMSVDELDERFNAILAEPAETLADTAEQLDRAHAVLRDALQEG